MTERSDEQITMKKLQVQVPHNIQTFKALEH